MKPLIRLRLGILGALGLLISGCHSSTEPPPHATVELVFYDWANDIPPTVFDQFTATEGIKVRYVPYESVDEVTQTIIDRPAYDLVVLDNETIPTLLEDNHLLPLSHQLLPNIKNIDPAFRDLNYDPGNHYCVPFNWSTTGLLVRRDLVERIPQTWGDLWSDEYRGKIGLVSDPQTMVGIALTVLGYPFNSENHVELQTAQAYLEVLRPSVVYVAPDDDEIIAQNILDGKAAVAVAWSGSALKAAQQSDDVIYVLPQDGTILWGDNFCIPVASRHPQEAHRLLNFLLRADVAAEIALYNHYATANLAARQSLSPEMQSDPISYPAPEQLTNAMIFTPISLSVLQEYSAIMETVLGEMLPRE